MQIIKNDSYFVVSPDKKVIDLHDDAFKKFIELFKEKIPNFKNVSLILDFSNIINIELNKILLLSQVSETHKNNNKSFVIVCQGIEYDKLPDELVAVPTLQEAEDIIEIEDIERDLGI